MKLTPNPILNVEVKNLSNGDSEIYNLFDYSYEALQEDIIADLVEEGSIEYFYKTKFSTILVENNFGLRECEVNLKNVCKLLDYAYDMYDIDAFLALFYATGDNFTEWSKDDLDLKMEGSTFYGNSLSDYVDSKDAPYFLRVRYYNQLKQDDEILDTPWGYIKIE